MSTYVIHEPEGGWRQVKDFSADEKKKLRPIAETLAMLDRNAFFGANLSDGREWYEQYLPEADALYQGNGGDRGWAGVASFASPLIGETARSHTDNTDQGQGTRLQGGEE